MPGSGAPWLPGRRTLTPPDGLAPDLDLFLEFHGQHVPFEVAATECTAYGSCLRVCCPRGVLFERYITAADAEVDPLSGMMTRLGEGTP